MSRTRVTGVVVPHPRTAWRILRVAVSVSLLAACSRTTDVSMVDALLNEAKAGIAPDRRTAVFDVHGTVSGTTLTLTGEIQDAGMHKRLLAFLGGKSGWTIVDSIVSLPAPSVGDRTFGIVNVSVANLRTTPMHPAELASQVLLGTPVKVLKKVDGWYLVQTPEEYLGWTDDRIVCMANDRYDAWARLPKLIVTAEFAWVRSGIEKSSRPVSDVVAGSLLGLRGSSGPLYEVEYPDGRTGFIGRDQSERFELWLAQAKDTPERIVATAKRFFGVPYLLGGDFRQGDGLFGIHEDGLCSQRRPPPARCRPAGGGRRPRRNSRGERGPEAGRPSLLRIARLRGEAGTCHARRHFPRRGAVHSLVRRCAHQQFEPGRLRLQRFPARGFSPGAPDHRRRGILRRPPARSNSLLPRR